MELLQSQAPVDQEFSRSSASARHGTLYIRHQTLDMGHRNLEILKRTYFQRGQNKAKEFPQNWNFSKYLNDLMIMSLVKFGMVWYGLVWYCLVWYDLVWFGMGGGVQMTSEFIHEEVTIMDYHELSNLITNRSNIY